MCNAKFVSLTPFATVSGPASEALESSTKKRRLQENNKQSHFQPEHSFDFEKLFADLTPSEESFPEISWSFDDETDSCDALLVESLERVVDGFSMGRKRSHSGLMRSKSIKSELSSLNMLARQSTPGKIDRVDLSSLLCYDTEKVSEDCADIFFAKGIPLRPFAASSSDVCKPQQKQLVAASTA